jgi:hypothetical protein
MASNTIKAQVAASPRAANPADFDMTAGRVGYYLGDGSVPSYASACVNVSGATLTLTLPDPAVSQGRHLFISTGTAHAVISASANVLPIISGAAGTAICAATAGKFAHLISSGSHWQVVGGN